MRLDGIEAQYESFDERSEYTLARRYMNYEIRGEANAEELAWLHDHLVLWLRALKAAGHDTQHHIRRARADLAADPRKPAGDATAETHVQWKRIKAEASRIEAPRRAFLAKVRDRLETVRGLLPADAVSLEMVNVLVPRLLDIELLIRDGELKQARIELANVVTNLAEKDNNDQP